MPQKKDNHLLRKLIKGQSKEKMKRTTNLLAIPKINHNAERVTNLSGKNLSINTHATNHEFNLNHHYHSP